MAFLPPVLGGEFVNNSFEGGLFMDLVSLLFRWNTR